jgi:ribosome silencing factor RsfS/YbeB/iojap
MTKNNSKNKASGDRLPLTQLIDLVCEVLADNKAEQIDTIHLQGKADFADAMVVASGTSARHVTALADHLTQALKKNGYENVPTEGMEAGEWVLVDAGDVIVHLFKPDAREHYKLEKMWSV